MQDILRQRPATEFYPFVANLSNIRHLDRLPPMATYSLTPIAITSGSDQYLVP